ncbi:MAG: adenine-specific methyltransferase EcoRI family protein, partial [Dolichospermum sp.]
REYVAQLVKYDKKFLIIGNINAITYKEIFKLIKENKAWLGINLGRGISGFIVPEHYQLYGTEARIDNSGNRIVSPNNCLWLTNLDTSKRHQDIALTKRYFGNEAAYPKYDNYDGINVNKTQDIPLDFIGFLTGLRVPDLDPRGLGDAGLRHVQPDLDHGLLERLAVLALVDRLGLGADHADMVFR